MLADEMKCGTVAFIFALLKRRGNSRLQFGKTNEGDEFPAKQIGTG